MTIPITSLSNVLGRYDVAIYMILIGIWLWVPLLLFLSTTTQEKFVYNTLEVTKKELLDSIKPPTETPPIIDSNK